VSVLAVVATAMSLSGPVSGRLRRDYRDGTFAARTREFTQQRQRKLSMAVGFSESPDVSVVVSPG